MCTSNRKSWFARHGLVIFGVGLALRLAHLWSMRTSPFCDVLLGDAQGYDGWAREIARGDWLGKDVFYQAPLYPYFLSAIYIFHPGIHQSPDPSFHPGLAAARVTQAFIGAGSCVLLGYSARELFGNAAGLVAGLVLACYAPALFSGWLVQKSVLDIFLLCLLLASLCSLMRDPVGTSTPGSSAVAETSAFNSRWLIVGVALGALSLTRENALVFLPVVLGWIWLRDQARRTTRLEMTALLLAGAAMLLLPVGLRNRFVGGEFRLTTTQSGPNFFIGNNPRADGTYAALRFGRGSPEFERLDATELAAQAIGRIPSPGEVSSYWTKRALDYIRTQPLDWLALEGHKFRLLWNAAEVMDTESQESHADYSPVLRGLAHVAHFGALAPLAFLGMWITWGERRRLWLLYALLAAYTLSTLAFYVVARYRLPLAPFLIVFAAGAVVRAGRFLRTNRPAATSICGASVVAVTVFCDWPAVSADVGRAATYHNLGAALQEDGRLDEAADAYERALNLRPEYAPSLNGLGSVRRLQGKLDEAIARLEEALRLHPDFEDASYNLANALVDQGRLPEAIARYQELLTRRPHALDVQSNLGIALVAAGRLDEAIQHFRLAVEIAPRRADSYYNLGHALSTRGTLDEAIENLVRAVQIEPTHVSAHYELANAYLAGRQLEQAASQYREIIQLSPEFAQAHNNLGIVLGSLGRLDDAVGEFRRALAINPSFSQARENLQIALDASRQP